MTALIILALVSSSVLTVINRCMAAAADSALRMDAFEVARDNMEKLLASDSVSEMVEYGTSDKYPEIYWETVVETFYEPLTSRMWIQAVCSAEYVDTAGEEQTVELTHWLTDLTKDQLLRIAKDKQKEKRAQLADEIIETAEEAAEYAGVDEQTIDQWVENGMPVTEDGHYVKEILDLYQQYNGRPPPAVVEQAEAVADSTEALKELVDQGDRGEQAGQGDRANQAQDGASDEDELLPGLGPNPTMEEIMDWIRRMFGM